MTLLILVAGCGDEPVPADRAGSQPAPAAKAGPGAVVLAGEIELGGELAALEQAAVFVIGYKAGTNQLALVDKLELSSASARGAGEVVLPFALGTSHTLTEATIDELELEVRVDLNGLVDGPDDVVGRSRIPVTLGDLDVRVRLDDGHRTDVPLGG